MKKRILEIAIVLVALSFVLSCGSDETRTAAEVAKVASPSPTALQLRPSAPTLTAVPIRQRVGRIEEGSPTLPDTPVSTPTSSVPNPRIEVSLKLDPRITRGRYTGEQWVSPDTYTIVLPTSGGQIEAKGHLIYEGAYPMGEPVEWMSADTSIMTVYPTEGPKTTLTILKEGKTSLNIISGDTSRILPVNATIQNQAMLVNVILRNRE